MTDLWSLVPPRVRVSSEKWLFHGSRCACMLATKAGGDVQHRHAAAAFAKRFGVSKRVQVTPPPVKKAWEGPPFAWSDVFSHQINSTSCWQFCSEGVRHLICFDERKACRRETKTTETGCHPARLGWHNGECSIVRRNGNYWIETNSAFATDCAWLLHQEEYTGKGTCSQACEKVFRPPNTKYHRDSGSCSVPSLDHGTTPPCCDDREYIIDTGASLEIMSKEALSVISAAGGAAWTTDEVTVNIKIWTHLSQSSCWKIHLQCDRWTSCERKWAFLTFGKEEGLHQSSKGWEFCPCKHENDEHGVAWTEKFVRLQNPGPEASANWSQWFFWSSATMMIVMESYILLPDQMRG